MSCPKSCPLGVSGGVGGKGEGGRGRGREGHPREQRHMPKGRQEGRCVVAGGGR